jgi:hypothetical protein
MPLPILPDQTPVQLIVRGFCNDTTDMENVLYGVYTTGPTPQPGGLNLGQVAANFLLSWQNLWTPFTSANSNIRDCTIRVLDSVTPVAPNRFKFTVTEQWTVSAPVLGTLGGGCLPSYCAYGVQKRTFTGGRGRQGHVRIWGVPESSVDPADGNRLASAEIAAIQAALDTQGTDFSVHTGAFTDVIELTVMNGKLVNVNPGHPVTFYMVFPQALQLEFNVATQITRKFARHRS